MKYSDLFVKTQSNTFFIVETKGREDLDDTRKIQRLFTWCKDINAAQKEYTYTRVYIKQEKLKNELRTLTDVYKIFEVK